jgi:hypothetical protein
MHITVPPANDHRSKRISRITDPGKRRPTVA